MIAEYYNAETGAIPKKAALAFGWTAAVFIDLAIRDTHKTGTVPGWEAEG